MNSPTNREVAEDLLRSYRENDVFDEDTITRESAQRFIDRIESALAAAEARGRAAGAESMRERAAAVVKGQMLGQSRSRRNELMRLIIDMIRLLPPLSAPAKQEGSDD